MYLADRGRRNGLLGKSKEDLRQVANTQLTTKDLTGLKVAEWGDWEREDKEKGEGGERETKKPSDARSA